MVDTTQTVRSILPLLFLSLLLISCGESEEPALEEVPAQQPLEMLEPEEVVYDYNPEDKEAFENAVYLQHIHLMGQVSKKSIDSIMKVNFLDAKDPMKGKEIAKEEVKKWMERQDTLARMALVNQFNISRDSVETILRGRGR